LQAKTKSLHNNVDRMNTWECIKVATLTLFMAWPNNPGQKSINIDSKVILSHF